MVPWKTQHTGSVVSEIGSLENAMGCGDETEAEEDSTCQVEGDVGPDWSEGRDDDKQTQAQLEELDGGSLQQC